MHDKVAVQRKSMNPIHGKPLFGMGHASVASETLDSGHHKRYPIYFGRRGGGRRKDAPTRAPGYIQFSVTLKYGGLLSAFREYEGGLLLNHPENAARLEPWDCSGVHTDDLAE